MSFIFRIGMREVFVSDGFKKTRDFPVGPIQEINKVINLSSCNYANKDFGKKKGFPVKQVSKQKNRGG